MYILRSCFASLASAQFRLFKTTSIGNDFELTEETL